MKKKVALLLTAVMLMGTLAACGNDNSQQSTAGSSAESSAASDSQAAPAGDSGQGKQLVVQVGPNPETIDPALNSAIDGGNMLLHVFEGLLTVGEDNSIQPGQAETWEMSEDGTTWTFHLRDGLKWSDGSDLTANDFVYSWKRVCDPAVAAPYAETVLNTVKGFAEAQAGNLDALGVSAPDDKTFVVELAAPCPYFESLAAFATLSPVQQATVETNGDGWAINADTYITNGSFYISEWVPSSHIVMSKNPNYWNADAIKLDSIKWLLMEDSNAAYSAFQSGDAMFVKDVPTQEIPSLKENPQFHVDTTLGTYYLDLNLNDPAFEDVRVRKALSLAIDRNYVANTLMQGIYSPASNFIGNGWVDTDGSQFIDNANGGKPYIDLDNFEANLEEAKQLMADAGYPDGKGLPTIVYSTNDMAYHKVVAEYLQQAWAELGVTVEVDIVEWASFTPLRRNGDYMASRDGWAGDYSDPSNMLELFETSNGNNNAKYSSAEYDKLIQDARSTIDKAKRSELLHQAEDLIMEDVACVPIAYYNDFWLQSEKIQGSWHSPYGYWYFMYADIAE